MSSEASCSRETETDADVESVQTVVKVVRSYNADTPSVLKIKKKLMLIFKIKCDHACINQPYAAFYHF